QRRWGREDYSSSAISYKYLFGRRIFRQSKMERRTALGIVCGPKFPSMRSDEGPADRKTESHSLGFRGEERLEDLFHFFRWNAAAAVGDGHNHCITTVLDSSTNAQPALRSVAIRHCVTSIDHQVDQDLLKLHRVAGDGRQISRQFSINTDVLTDEIGTDQLQDIPHNLVDTERMLLHLAFLQPQAQPTDDFGSVLVFADDVIKNFAKLGDVDAAIGEHSLGGLRIAENG